MKPKLMIKDVLVRDTTASNIDDPACELRRGVQPADSGLRLESRKRETLAQLSYAELTRSLIHSFIGSNQPHRAQVEALDALADHQSVLAVMGTGRGKSLIFHVHAAREAVLRGRASIFVYPLRALVADQAYHLSSTMAALGIGVGVLTGETVEAARDDVFAGLASGRTGIVLTTPEFLSIHRDRFARSGRIGFVVIDEAHHAGLAKGGDRSAYLDMPDILKALGDPVVMAATATATAPVVAELARMLPITRTVVDETVRENLQLEDDRDLASRENRLVSIVATGRRPSFTSIRATSPWRSPRRCASVCPIAQPISRSITRGLRVPIAAAWRKHSETEASAASFRPPPLARVSTCPISAMSCSTTCRLAPSSSTR